MERVVTDKRMKPLAVFRPVNLGRKFVPEDDALREQYLRGRVVRNKASRRVLRREALRGSSRIERAIDKARKLTVEHQRIATNSHEAKRYVELARKELRDG